ncbi:MULTISPECIES: DUF484 domain-containing protein [Edwardsiella]|uniref:DUF484 domain-containing protein n=2 Tax=Edwardsiella anguillarum TaxID=1821960 RepID=A0A076LIE9_9GAMM|nr:MULTISPECIES: DUF484 domain-containing protein [Edwardsiella]AIJ08330.1 Protein of unknown function DUF484 [Edwardsiella anguillarum ET080813]AKR76429.1 DUF484 domain-containing protein [Edwardsiella sp. LADL05-105]KAB0591607.1 DUF484 domain-containing protein [Edwardsiella anguillarum]UOU78941.1 DUF484 domain-containing protein [Edwardsiella anguillarum]WHP80441.1 DUF484 domain-containing protein [Edwardsiella anguillarum]
MSERDSRDLLQPSLADEQVVAYLQQHPDFFIRNARQVEQMMIPHPVRGAVSLLEWQLGRQRRQIAVLDQEIEQLITLARDNERLFGSLLALQGHLASAQDMDDFLQRLQRWARSLGLSGAYIRLFADRWRLGAPSRFSHLAIARSDVELLRIQRLGDASHYLGSLNGQELLLLLPQARHVGSVALSLMGDFADLGLLVFTSADAQHYQQGMGTALLEQLARLIPPMLTRWIERQ